MKDFRNTTFEKFKIGFNLLENKLLFVISTFLGEIPEILIAWAVSNGDIVTFLISPVLLNITTIYGCQREQREASIIRSRWCEKIIKFLESTRYGDRMNTNSSELIARIENTGRGMVSIVIFLFSVFVKLTFATLSSIYIMVTGRHYAALLIFPAILAFNHFHAKPLRKKLETMRSDSVQLGQKYKSPMLWILNLIKNRNKQPEDFTNMSKELINKEIKHFTGHITLTLEMRVVIKFISSLVVFFISSTWTEVLANYVAFINLNNAFGYLGMINNLVASNIGEFDKLRIWIEGVKIDPKRELKPIEYPLKINSSIVLPNGLNIWGNVDIHDKKKVLIKGCTGVGKTTFLKALMGFIEGIIFRNSGASPKDYEEHFEYLSQNARESIPTHGLTLRELLGNEKDTELIEYAARLVDFNSKDFDEELKDLSGGEKMKVSIMYSIVNFRKTKKQIFILDEPEQGLDMNSTRTVLNNILKIDSTILVVYHGHNVELLNLKFDECWEFNRISENETHIEHYAWEEYQEKIIRELCDETHESVKSHIIAQYCTGIQASTTAFSDNEEDD